MATAADVHPTTQDLLSYIQASPTPYHCVQETISRLEEDGFTPLLETKDWSLEPGAGHYIARGGALIAIRVGTSPAHEAGFRLLGAHSDSPNLRVKPQPDVNVDTYGQLGVEVYGGVLLYTWFDRDLGLAGRVVLRGDAPGTVESKLVNITRPIARVPSLAIHLNRDIRKDGFQVNEQQHLAPLMLMHPSKDETTSLKELLSEEMSVPKDKILSWDLSLADVVPPSVGGWNNEFIYSPRLDNQGMCHAGLLALRRVSAAKATQVVCLHDHEEVGSGSTSGAAGSFVEDVIRRIAEVEGPGAKHGFLPKAVAHTYQVSADMAHALHPNYTDRHEPQHMPVLNGGPVIKINVQQRYATDGESAALFESLCQDADVPCQKFVTRTDLPCGSTIGPISASRLGIRTVDVGNPMLSMHSIREQAGSQDPERMVAVMAKFLAV